MNRWIRIGQVTFNLDHVMLFNAHPDPGLPAEMSHVVLKLSNGELVEFHGPNAIEARVAFGNIEDRNKADGQAPD